MSIAQKTSQAKARDFRPVCLTKVRSERRRWLWKPFIPFGAVTLLIGVEGDGKSTFARALAAVVTGGGKLPNVRRRKPGSVLWLTKEEDWGTVAKPALRAAGADMKRVFTIEDATRPGEPAQLHFPGDESILEGHIQRLSIDLVVIDPIADYFADHVKPNDERAAREVMRGLNDIARRTGCAILPIRHVGKSEKTRAVHGCLGSVGWTAVARSVLVIGPHPENKELRVLLQPKANGPKGQALAFGIVQSKGQGVVEWGRRLEQDAEDLAHAPGDDGAHGQLAHAKAIITKEMAKGPVKAQDILKAGRLAGISERTMWRAKEQLGILDRRTGFAETGSSQWYRPEDGSR